MHSPKAIGQRRVHPSIMEGCLPTPDDDVADQFDDCDKDRRILGGASVGGKLHRDRPCISEQSDKRTQNLVRRAVLRIYFAG